MMLSAAPGAAPWAIGGAVFGLLAWVTVEDARSFTIPDLALAPLAGIAGAAAWDAGVPLWQMALGIVAPAAALWLVRETFYRRRGVDALGFGDVKLAGVLGLLLGVEGFALALLAASLAGLAFAGALRLAGRDVTAETKLPLGAFLAPAAFALWCLTGGGTAALW